MATKYIVYDPTTGQNTYVNSEQEARELFLQIARDFLSPYFHNVPYTVAEIDENGVETTTAPTSVTVESILLSQTISFSNL